MKFQITGKQIDIGDALQTHVKDELSSLFEKYPGRPTDANVVFSRSGSEFLCEAAVHLSSGLTAQASGNAHEIYAAFDNTQEKMDKQLRRYKRRLKDHHRDRPDPVEVMEAASYILASQPESEDEAEDASPVIVAEMETKVPTLSVSAAVMQMEIADARILVFRNEKHNGVNVVYRRDDGNVGWIDPRNAG